MKRVGFNDMSPSEKKKWHKVGMLLSDVDNFYEVNAWCEKQASEALYSSRIKMSTYEGISFSEYWYFKSNSDALLFRLRWAKQIDARVGA